VSNLSKASGERRALFSSWPAEYRQGYDDGLKRRLKYPQGFNEWVSKRQDAYYAGYNRGRLDRPDVKVRR